MIILFSALTLCLVAVLAFTAEARYAKKTRTRGNAKMLSLIEKMKQRLPAPESRAQVRDDDDCPGTICPGDWCCTDADLTCCDEDSPYVCADDPDVCDTCPGQMCDGDWCCPFDDWTCCDEDSDYICAVDADTCDSDQEKTRANARMNPLLMKMKKHAPKVKAQVRDDDDCDGKVCPGDWCCPAEYADWTCCDEDSPNVCAVDASYC